MSIFGGGSNKQWILMQQLQMIQNARRAREALLLKAPDVQDPNIKMGTEDKTDGPASTEADKRNNTTRTKKTGVVKSKVFGASVSKIGGL